MNLRGLGDIDRVRAPFNPLGQPYEYVSWLKEQQGGHCTCGRCGLSAPITTSSNQPITCHERHKCDSAQCSGLHNEERCACGRSAEERGACAS